MKAQIDKTAPPDPDRRSARAVVAKMRSRLSANSFLLPLPIGAVPPVSTPLLRRVSRKSRILRRAFMLSREYNVPLGFNATPPFSITSAASGMSAVTTRSPGESRRRISLSAISNPVSTRIVAMNFDRGIGRGRFATRVSCVRVRSAARNSISLIATGHASASTHIFNSV